MEWSPKKLVLASMAVAIVSSAVTGGLVVWLTNGQKPAEAAMFSPNSTMSQPVAATPPADSVQAGNWFYDRERWNEAISAYEKALANGFDSPDMRTDLGNCYRFSNRPETALEQYQIAQKQNPNHEQSLYNQATLYAESLKNSAKADEVARLYLAHFPSSENVEAVKKYLSAPDSGAK